MPSRYQLPFDPRHLVGFVEVAQRLHFRNAGEALGLAQPALSRQIRQLEADLGTALLTRTRRRVELTAAGRLLQERVAPLLTQLCALGDEVRAVAAGETGVLRIRFTGLAMATVLPALVRGYTARCPGVRVELTESPTAQQLPALLSGECDLGLLHPDGVTRGLSLKQILLERNGVVLPAGHPLAKGEPLTLKSLAQTPWVLFPRPHNPAFYDRVLEAFAEARISPRIADEVWPRANAIGLVRAGLGTTFMCPSEARELPADVVFRPLKGPAPESRLAIAWRDPASQAARRFVDLLATQPKTDDPRNEKPRSSDGARG